MMNSPLASGCNAPPHFTQVGVSLTGDGAPHADVGDFESGTSVVITEAKA